TGESPTLTSEEKARLFAEVKTAVGNRGAVVAGTGTYNTSESIELTREAENSGVDAVLLTTPYYSKPPQEGLYRHFAAIAAATSPRTSPVCRCGGSSAPRWRARTRRRRSTAACCRCSTS